MRQQKQLEQSAARRWLFGLPVGAWLLVCLVLEFTLLVLSTLSVGYSGTRAEAWLYNCNGTVIADTEYFDDNCGWLACHSCVRQHTFTERRTITVSGEMNGQILSPTQIEELIPRIEDAINDDRFDFGQQFPGKPGAIDIVYEHADPIHRILWWRIGVLIGLIAVVLWQLWLFTFWIRNFRADLRDFNRENAIANGICPCCRYDIRQLTGSRCPECGESIHGNQALSR